MGKLASIWTQMAPPAPTFTEASLPNQKGRVFIVTGGNSGVGLELIKLLYPTGAAIYMASRSRERAEAAITQVISDAAKLTAPKSPGTITFLHLDLDDLTTIKSSAAAFASRESRLDVLWNNAGLALVTPGSKTAQGIETHIGVNCVAPLLFTQELLPLLRNAAASSAPGMTRVVWTSSIAAETLSVSGGVDFSILDDIHTGAKGTGDWKREYGMSKVGNWFFAAEGARRWGTETAPGKGDAVVSVVENPGQLNTPSYRHQSKLFMAWFRLTLYPPKFGGYTMLFAGLSPEVGLETNGAYIRPWGRLQEKSSRQDIEQAIKDGRAKEFWAWCERAYKPYV